MNKNVTIKGVYGSCPSIFVFDFEQVFECQYRKKKRSINPAYKKAIVIAMKQNLKTMFIPRISK